MLYNFVKSSAYSFTYVHEPLYASTYYYFAPFRICPSQKYFFPPSSLEIDSISLHLSRLFNAVINEDFIFDFKSRTLPANFPRNERKFFAQKIEPAILTVPAILRISASHLRPFLPHSHHTMPPNTSFTYNIGLIILRPGILFPYISLSQSKIILSSPAQSHVFAPKKRQHLHPT